MATTLNGLLITNVRALEPGEGVIATWLGVRDGKIAELGSRPDAASEYSQQIDGGGRLLTPGLIDIHTHGIKQFAYEAGQEAFVAATRELAEYGTTSVLPTIYRSLSRPRLSDLERFAAATAMADSVCIPGLHLEGPFLALPGAGANRAGRSAALGGIVGGRAADGWPLCPLAPRCRTSCRSSNACASGESCLSSRTPGRRPTDPAGDDAGARHATHFYDVFHLPEETDPGVRPVGAVEAILADPRCTVDFIADGVHVHPTAIRAAVAAKGPAGVMLTTDSNIGEGLPPGLYDSPMGQIKTSDAARLHRPGDPLDGGLAAAR